MEQKKAWNDKDVLNPRFLGSWDILNGSLIVKIIEAKTEEVDNYRTNKKENKLVIYLVNQKPLVCNITNAKAISKALKSKFLDDWKGKNIEITTKRIRAFGEDTEALRVKDIAPTVKKEVLTISHQRYEAAKLALKENKITIEKLKETFEISEEICKSLK